MKVLAVDTAAAGGGSVALLDGENLLDEQVADASRSPAQRLMELVADVLQRGRTGLAAVDLFAVTRGPGSFTGLRIGMATVQGLALAAGKPVVGVSTLEALAASVDGEAVVAAMIDARRGEVYTAVYRTGARGMTVLAPEAVMPPAAAAARIVEPCWLIGSGARVYASEWKALLGGKARFAPPEIQDLHAVHVGRLALQQAGSAVAPGLLTPCYLRPADAKRPQPWR